MTEQKARAVGVLVGQATDLSTEGGYGRGAFASNVDDALEAISVLLCPPVASPERWNATKAGATNTLPGGEDY
jgi:hypothetical protein